MKPLKLTKGQAQQAMGIMRAELRTRLGIFLTDDSASHGLLRAAVIARLCGLTPRDECFCGGLLRLDGGCRDCGKGKADP